LEDAGTRRASSRQAAASRCDGEDHRSSVRSARRRLGYGFLERVYERALQVELLRRGLNVEIEKRARVKYKNVVVGDYDADLVVNGVVLAELKVNPQYDRRDEAQLLNVLKATGLRVGLLINFGRTKVEYKRLIF
jgi:GxxExxY protein